MAVAGAVEGELRATRPLMMYIPKHGCPVLLIERVPCINEEKPPVLFLRVLLPEDAHCMYAALYPRFYSPVQLDFLAGGLCLLPRHPKQALFHQPSSRSSHANRSDPWLIFQCDQPVAHHCAIGGPWGPPIAQPICKVADNQPQFTTCRPKTQQSVLQDD